MSTVERRVKSRPDILPGVGEDQWPHIGERERNMGSTGGGDENNGQLIEKTIAVVMLQIERKKALRVAGDQPAIQTCSRRSTASGLASWSNSKVS